MYVLQWGRGKKASEILICAIKLKGKSHASMGPRQKSLGNCGANCAVQKSGFGFNGAEAKKPRKSGCVLRDNIHALAASMGPRQKSLGNPTSEIRGRHAMVQLQWGRGKKASEIHLHQICTAMGTELQWGRGKKASEIR